MNDYISKPVNTEKLFSILSHWLLNEMPEQQEDVIKPEEHHSDLVDLEHLELFTEGDLDLEKTISDAFFSQGQECLDVMAAHIDEKNSNDDWKSAAHKLKGSAAQLGASPLSEVCSKAQEIYETSLQDKQELLTEINRLYEKVKEFFTSRQTV